MDKRRTEYPEAVAMYDRGLSIQDVADFHGVTRQSMWDWLTRRGAKMRPHLKYGPQNHFHRKGSRAVKRAIHAVEKAVQKGVLVRPPLCQKCGQPSVFKDGRSAIEGHHEDYSKPLDVMWLCQKCHFDLHAAKNTTTTAST